jgi:DNA-binding LytR/AlgR family response regulator
MITAIAIDDEPLALEVIKEFSKRVDYISLKSTFTRAGNALEYLNENPVDLLFLDIDMPLISGIDLYKKVTANTQVIFTTAYSQYAVEGFNLNAIDYLLKPIEFCRFQKAVEKAQEYITYLRAKSKEDEEYLFLKIDHSITKIALSDVYLIEGQDNYLKILLDSGKRLLVRMTMTAMQQNLPTRDFIRVHRSFILPKKKITSIKNKTAFMGDLQIPISAPYLKAVSEMFSGEEMK